jgi:very-short-patch-repair endonuclease
MLSPVHAVPVEKLREHQAGVLTVAQAQRFLSRKAVRHRVSSGRWQRPHPSVLVTHNGPVGPDEHRWIAVLAAGDRATLAGLSAAAAWGLRGFETTAVHVLVPAHRRPRHLPSGVIVHRTSVLGETDILPLGKPPRTRAARSLVDAAQWAHSDDVARALIAAAFQQRLTTAPDLRDVLTRLPRARRHKLIMETAADADAGSHSLGEIRFLALCRHHLLPDPSRQVVRHDAAGRRRYLDVLFEEWHVHVEIDGGQHLEVRQAWADMRRQNELWIAGDRVLRFPAWALRHDPETVMSQVRAALQAAGWPG